MPSLTFEPIAVPLREDEHGAIRVGNTRVTLETLVHQFRQGATPESVAQDFDSLNLRDVYAVFAYYLQHQDEIDEYLRDCDHKAQAVRQQIQTVISQDPNLRAKLLARAKAKEGGDAAAVDR